MSETAAMRPGAEAPVAGELVVFHDVAAGDTGGWGLLVDELARALGLTPSYMPVGGHGPLWVDRLLRAAAAAPGPVLVLPQDPLGPTTPSPHLVRLVIASGDAADVIRAAGLLVRRLRIGGVHSTVLVVLADGAVPSMWEGPGHHAAAWRTELQRRHEGADTLRVVGGVDELGRAIHDHAVDADAVVLLWRRVATEGRAMVVRSLLGISDGVPSLLVPMDWIATLRGGAAGPVVVAQLEAGRSG